MSTEGLDALSPLQAQQFAELQSEAKDLAVKGFLIESLNLFLKAKQICPTKKVLSRIAKLKDVLKQQEEEEKNEESVDEEMIEVTEGFALYHEIYKKLFPYQREGVAWMYKLYERQKGGILGDDMGLGKTFQVIAFLSGMKDADLIQHILIIMPVSLLPNWKNEFKKWCPGIMVYEFHGSSKKERERNLDRVQRRGGVLLTSYGMITGNYEQIAKKDGLYFVWDYVILDEGHKIKNPTKTTKAVHEIPAKCRLVLTGTPIQNNLQELWALFDFAHNGTLLGSRTTFKLRYVTPITRGREKDASSGERLFGQEMAENLRKLIDRYFLRRTKDVLDQFKPAGDNDNDNGAKDINELGSDLDKLQLSTLSKKNDLIMWVILSQTQYEIYTSFLETDAVKNILLDKRSPLVQLTILKKICDHPRLLSHRACLKLGLNGNISEEELQEMDDENANAVSIENVSDETLINESGKLKFAIELLESLRQTKHRTLVFSLSRKILDMIQRILTNRGWKVLRIDGTITKMADRQKRINLFQQDSSYPVFLLTTQVGGVGITLTAADRVIIYDPSWNPATDAQAVDRAYRIGQKKNVVIYRLITCGSIEEKIYRRQIFKDSITRQATGSSGEDPHRYFSKQELRELFVVDDIHYSNTQVQLAAMHSAERKSDTSLDEHIAFLHSLNIFGVSDHDLMFTKTLKDETVDNDDPGMSRDFIKKRVEMAEQEIQTEANVIEEGLKQSGMFVKPFSLSIPSSAKKSASVPYQPPQFPNTIDADLAKVNFHAKGDVNRQFRTPLVNNYLYRDVEVVDISDNSDALSAATEKTATSDSGSEKDNESIKPSDRDEKYDIKSASDSVMTKEGIGGPSVNGSCNTYVRNSLTSTKFLSDVCHIDVKKSSPIKCESTSSPKIQSEGDLSDCKTHVANSSKKIQLEDLEDLDIFGQDIKATIGSHSKRQSCARRVSAVVLSESDASNITIPDILVSESDEELSERDEHSSSSELEEVQNSDSSAPNTPLNIHKKNNLRSEKRTSRSFTSGDQLEYSVPLPRHSMQNSALSCPSGDAKKHRDAKHTFQLSQSFHIASDKSGRSNSRLPNSPKRITPLRVINEKPSPHKTPFEEAMQTSIELPATPSRIHTEPGDSPLHRVKKPVRKIIDSDSSDSEDKVNSDSFSSNKVYSKQKESLGKSVKALTSGQKTSNTDLFKGGFQKGNSHNNSLGQTHYNKPHNESPQVNSLVSTSSNDSSETDIDYGSILNVKAFEGKAKSSKSLKPQASKPGISNGSPKSAISYNESLDGRKSDSFLKANYERSFDESLQINPTDSSEMSDEGNAEYLGTHRKRQSYNASEVKTLQEISETKSDAIETFPNSKSIEDYTDSDRSSVGDNKLNSISEQEKYDKLVENLSNSDSSATSDEHAIRGELSRKGVVKADKLQKIDISETDSDADHNVSDMNVKLAENTVKAKKTLKGRTPSTSYVESSFSEVNDFKKNLRGRNRKSSNALEQSQSSDVFNASATHNSSNSSSAKTEHSIHRKSEGELNYQSPSTGSRTSRKLSNYKKLLGTVKDKANQSSEVLKSESDSDKDATFQSFVSLETSKSSVDSSVFEEGSGESGSESEEYY